MTFANVLIQQRYTSELYQYTQKVIYIIQNNFNTMESVIIFSVIFFFGYLFFNSNLKDTTNFDNKF